MYELIPFISFKYHKARIWIMGISDEPFITIRTVNIKLFNQLIKFHVIQDSIQIPYNGILGVEFLNKNKVIIDFGNKNLYFNNH